MTTETVLILDHMEFTTLPAYGKPERLEDYDAVTVTYTDGTSKFVWYPRTMAAVLFAATVTWLKQRVGSGAGIRRLEFDR
jgi:hypothetical protein